MPVHIQSFGVEFWFCLLSLEAKDPERVSAWIKPSCDVWFGSILLQLPVVLPVLQAAAGRPLQGAALQTSKADGSVCFNKHYQKYQDIPIAPQLDVLFQSNM